MRSRKQPLTSNRRDASVPWRRAFGLRQCRILKGKRSDGIDGEPSCNVSTISGKFKRETRHSSYLRFANARSTRCRFERLCALGTTNPCDQRRRLTQIGVGHRLQKPTIRSRAMARSLPDRHSASKPPLSRHVVRSLFAMGARFKSLTLPVVPMTSSCSAQYWTARPARC